MKFKKNDIVQVITGKYKGKQGKVIKILRDKNRLIVEGINIIKKHPDLADKIKINKGLSELSNEEQTRSGLKDCSEEEFNLFNDLNSRFKNKFNIPFIFAVRNKNKNEKKFTIYSTSNGYFLVRSFNWSGYRRTSFLL